MINCPKCGALCDETSRYCSYCKTEINPEGKIENSEAFVVSNIFSIAGRFLLMGKALQKIKTSDKLIKNKIPYEVIGIQKGNAIVQSIDEQNDCGILLKDLKKGDVKIGDKFYF